ncbi:hypothetical protein J1TS3_45260 [Siminovitchia fordii]|uniref:Uncharacterized protein n=1 Tax=Siminovitchia fordii TaxID=254759 RepID=A0ABQ4KCD7_9BACI|nr:hypothetical protein J1TS3_45260 [Siminovitchia fordii]
MRRVSSKKVSSSKVASQASKALQDRRISKLTKSWMDRFFHNPKEKEITV